MSKQVWITKKAQDLTVGDIISGQTKTIVYALEISKVWEEGDRIRVDCYADLYKQFLNHFFMTKNQDVPVAVSGVVHMDEIKEFHIG